MSIGQGWEYRGIGIWRDEQSVGRGAGKNGLGRADELKRGGSRRICWSTNLLISLLSIKLAVVRRFGPRGTPLARGYGPTKCDPVVTRLWCTG